MFVRRIGVLLFLMPRATSSKDQLAKPEGSGNGEAQSAALYTLISIASDFIHHDVSTTVWR